nr:MAG TPA: hypothetical protein [Caudoviricetes sp.]
MRHWRCMWNLETPVLAAGGIILCGNMPSGCSLLIFAPFIFRVCSRRERLLPLFFLPLLRQASSQAKARMVFLILWICRH